MIILLFIGWLVLAAVLGSMTLFLYAAVFVGGYTYEPIKDTAPGYALFCLAVMLVFIGLILVSCPLWWL